MKKYETCPKKPRMISCRNCIKKEFGKAKVRVENWVQTVIGIGRKRMMAYRSGSGSG